MVAGAALGVSRVVTRCARVPPPPRRQLARILLDGPRRVELYFKDRPFRRWTWRFISVGIGFLCGNTVTLTFGTLAANDVIAALVTVLFYMAVSQWYWSARNPTYLMELVNFFKNGVVLALVGDALKLSS